MASVMSTLNSLFWALRIRLPSLSVAAEGCSVLSLVEEAFDRLVEGGIAAFWLGLLYPGRQGYSA